MARFISVSMPLVAAFLESACGGAPAVPVSSTPARADGRSGATPEDAVQLCHDRGGPRRTDYSFIASYTCPDGTVPLSFDPARGANARLRNVGAGPDGHVLDLYEVPCPGGPVRIYVDAYHCPGQDVEIDPQNLSVRQRLHMAALARSVEAVVFDPRADALREELAALMHGSTQFGPRPCGAIVDAVAHRDYEHGRLLFLQLVASMGGAAVEAEGQVERARLELAGVLGALRLHDTIVAQRGPSAADPALRELVRLREQGELADHVRALSARCDQPRMGLMMMTEGRGNVWPPQGRNCDRLVRCCEERGLVRNGAAVPGTQGLMCLVFAAQPTDPGEELDCSAGLTTLELQGIQCP